MDFFYKPPLQKNDECAALETNYLNCLMQKALNDNVAANRCTMNSLIWFNLECPRWINQYDSPDGFKRRIKTFFDDQYFRKMSEVKGMERHKQPIVDTSERRNIHYPEDTKVHPVFEKFYEENEEALATEEPELAQNYVEQPEIPDEHKAVQYHLLEDHLEVEPQVNTHEYWQQYINDYRDQNALHQENRQRYLSGEAAPEVILYS